jgi:TonB-linked SusC/RagA family outer membrane protein
MRLKNVVMICVVSAISESLVSPPVAGQSMDLASGDRVVAARPGGSASPLSQLARLRVDHVSIRDALVKLQSQSGVSLVFSPSVVDGERRVSCDCLTVSVGEALRRMLAGTSIAYSQYGESVLIEPRRSRPTPEPPQDRTIHGWVTDSVSGVPVGNGQVTVVGTTLGTTLRGDGTFTLTVPSQPVTLLIRSLSYAPRTVNVPLNQDSVHVILVRHYFRLDEMVITGQATGVRKRNLANAVATVDADQLTRVPAPTIENQLQGKVPGVHISANSGAPGGGNIVRMRGVTSINGAFTPLYVVDGVIVSDANLGTGTNAIIRANGTSLNPLSGNEDNGDNRIADLNVNDIESIEVLKGASASAIYGSKAANGVIVITTKKGQVGPPQLEATQHVGFSKLEHEFGHRCFSLDEAVEVFGPQAANTWTPQCHDFEQELYGGTPLSYETSLSARGGTESTRYFASLLNSYDGGIVPNTNARRQSVRINLDQTVGSRLNVSIGAEAIRTERNPGVTQNGNNGTPIGGAIAYGGATWLNLQQLPNGTYPVNPFAASNPFQTVALFRNQENVHRNILSERVTYDLLNSEHQKLQFISTGGLDMFTQKNFVLSPPELFSEQFSAMPGQSALGFGQSQNTNLNANLVHTYTLNNGSTATSQIGVQYETQSLDASHTLAQGLVGGLSNIDQGLAVKVQENRQRVRDLGLFAQEEFLTLDERLLLTVGARADQSSNNGDPRKLFFYPKAAASYRIPGLPSFIEELKVRAAFGFSGNEPLYGQKFTELLPGNIAGAIPILGIQGNTGAADLRPERQREIETGVDATLLHSRLNLEATVYEKKVTDLLLQQTLAPTTGFSSLYFNGGSMRNRGLELSATGIPVQSSRFTWRTTGTYSMSRCTVLSLPVPAFRPATTINSSTFGYTFIEPGASCTQIYGRDTLGAEPGDAALGAPGTPIQRKLADDNPTFNASWSNQIDYGRFHLNMLLDGQKGGVLVNITEYEYDATKDSPDYLVPRHPGDLTGEQRQAAFAKTSRPYIQDVSYLKLREVNLSVDLPQSLVKGVWGGFRAARLELSGRNLLTFTPYHSTADPEANQIARSAAQGVPWDIWAYPPSRSFYFTVNLDM